MTKSHQFQLPIKTVIVANFYSRDKKTNKLLLNDLNTEKFERLDSSKHRKK